MEILPVPEALVDPHIQDQFNQDLFSGTLLDECKRSEVMGNLVQDASPLLFPCAIEYSLIFAAILIFRAVNTLLQHHHHCRVLYIMSKEENAALVPLSALVVIFIQSLNSF